MPSNLNETIKKIPFPKMIYPAITILFAVAVLFLFGKTIVFLTNNINKVFNENDPSLQREITNFDLANYEIIRKRYGWPELTATANAGQQNAVSIPAAAASSTTDNSSSSAAAEKAALNIRIFYGPGKNENDNALQEGLNQAGFIGTRTDVHQLILKNTIVQFKASNKNLEQYIEEIKKIIEKKYTIQIGTDLPKDASYDVSILVGKK